MLYRKIASYFVMFMEADSIQTNETKYKDKK